jgi:hypothetical protein
LEVVVVVMYSQSSNVVDTDRPSQDKFDRFEAWLRENGAQFDRVSLVFVGAFFCHGKCTVETLCGARRLSRHWTEGVVNHIDILVD